jgi:hypothetical protein
MFRPVANRASKLMSRGSRHSIGDETSDMEMLEHGSESSVGETVRPRYIWSEKNRGFTGAMVRSAKKSVASFRMSPSSMAELYGSNPSDRL